METTLTSSIIETILEQYRKDPANQSVIAILREVRQKLAEFWLNAPDELLENLYLGDIGKAHQLFLKSDFKYEALTDTENKFADELAVQVNQGFEAPRATQSLLAAMLYRRADRLPLQYKGAPIPDWFFNDLLKFMLDFPCYFQELGEVKIYFEFMQNLVSFLHKNILKYKDTKFWQDVALLFANNSNLVPLYFSDRNLRDIYSKRAEILEFALKSLGHPIDFVFPDRSATRQKIRLGILKADFSAHSETFTTIPAFEHLDREKFEIIVYVIDLVGNPLEQYIQGCADKLVHLKGELQTQVQTIRADDLDILFVGSIVTNSLQRVILLTLHRLARIQVTYFASPVTTGMRNIDYYISGSLTERMPAAKEHYREKLILLEGTGFCFNYTIQPAQFSINFDRKSLEIPERSLVFISGANFYKIIPELRETWVKILAAVPNSVLVLYPFSATWKSSYPGTPFFKNMTAILAKYGIDKNRLFILNALPSRADVKECLKLADIYLDSYPYSGANSTVDPLEVGLPTIVMDGEYLRTRQSAAMLRSLDLSDLIADSEAQYIQLSIALGNNPELRHRYREKIQQKMQENPSFLNSRAYSEQMGALFQKLINEK